MAKQLSQDLPIEDIDILWGDVEAPTDLDIIPEDTPPVETPAEVPAEEAPVEKPTEEVIPEEKGTEKVVTPPEEAPKETPKEEEITLDSILGDAKGIETETNAVVDQTVEMKDTIEEAQVAIKEDDTDSAEKLIDTLYTQVIEYSTSVDTLSAKNDILLAKIMELTKVNSDYELELAQNVVKSNDPKMLILNRMYDTATGWDENAKAKVITALEDMYYGLKSESFDDTRVNKESDDNAEAVILNELTTPELPEEPVEEVDLNDITSIF